MKKINAVLVCFAVLFVINAAACAEPRGTKNADRYNGDRHEEDAVRLDEAHVYHNAWLGISYTIPKGWWVYDLNSGNFCEEQDETANSLNLDIIYGNDTMRMDFANFANVPLSAQKNHLGFYLNAIRREGAQTIGDYMPGFEAFMLNVGGGEIVSVIASGTVVIGEISFEKRLFGVSRPIDDYEIITLSAPLKQGYFLNIIVDFWPDRKNAESAIFNAINDALVLD